MKTIEDVRKEYNELASKRDSYIKEANIISEQMLRLEGQAQLLDESTPKQETKKK